MKPQGFPEGLIRRGWRSSLPKVSLRSAVLVALGALSLSALAVFALGGAPGARAQPATTIQVGDNWFCDPEVPACMITDPNDVDIVTTISVGDTVVWEWGPGGAGTGDLHTTTHCADDFISCSGPGEWDSSPETTSGTFSHTFGPEDADTTFLYRCQIHPFDMRGSIIVLAAAEPSPSPQPSPEGSPEVSPQPSPPSATPTPIDIQPSTVPDGGGAPAAEGGTSMLWWLTIAAGGFLIASASFLLLRPRR